jgi:hypothetical protein
VSLPPEARNPFEDGPYVRIATICERWIEEKSGVMSLIGIIDRFTRTAVGTEVPAEMEPFPLKINLVLLLDAGSVRGSHEITVKVEAPSGINKPLLTTTMHFEGPGTSLSLVLPGELTLSSPGLYWFHVLFEQRLLTKVPMQIRYERVVSGGQVEP